jgi:phenylalanyl-tRNA synthetase beta chain
VPENIFSRIDDDKIAAMTEKYVKKSPKIVIAKILTATPHPESDHLQVLSVDAGQGTPLQIVCGAPNARAGLTSVLAMVGAKLPGFDAPLTARKMRGVLSNGMMCAADELGISNNHDGIIELPDDSVIGKEFKI